MDYPIKLHIIVDVQVLLEIAQAVTKHLIVRCLIKLQVPAVLEESFQLGRDFVLAKLLG